MKVGPVSGDLLVKLALGAAVIGAAWYAWRRLQAPAAEFLAGAGQVADAVIEGINPASQNNIVNRTANSAFQAVTGSSNTIGTSIYELFNNEPDATAPVVTWIDSRRTYAATDPRRVDLPSPPDWSEAPEAARMYSGSWG